MCEYQQITDCKIPRCVFTNSDCTFCVLGNAKTYKKAKEKEMANEGMQNKTNT